MSTNRGLVFIRMIELLRCIDSSTSTFGTGHRNIEVLADVDVLHSHDPRQTLVERQLAVRGQQLPSPFHHSVG
jgi:hypothetical protein